MPFEVKYRSQQPSRGRFKGLLEFCREKKVPRAWIVTQSMSDFGLLPEAPASAGISLMRIPAPLLCYWAGESEAGLGATAPAAMLE